MLTLAGAGEAGEGYAGGAGGGTAESCSPAMAALMERARAMRAAAYPASTVDGSSANTWDT